MINMDYFKNHTDYVEYRAGETIFNEGDTDSNTMYAVKEGDVDIVHNGQVLETVEPGHFFGEMALVDSSPRSASAVAKTDCKLVLVDKYHFLFLTHETPTFALQVMHVMAQRIRDLNKLLD